MSHLLKLYLEIIYIKTYLTWEANISNTQYGFREATETGDYRGFIRRFTSSTGGINSIHFPNIRDVDTFPGKASQYQRVKSTNS